MDRGVALFHRCDLAGAENEFREAIKLNPRNVDAHVGLGTILNGKLDLAGAEHEFREALKLDQASSKALFQPRHYP